jgi:hypothetical protein
LTDSYSVTKVKITGIFSNQALYFVLANLMEALHVAQLGFVCHIRRTASGELGEEKEVSQEKVKLVIIPLCGP